MVKVCGPKSSLCCLIISTWGIIQLVFMGIFYYFRSVALVEDLSLPEEEFPGLEEFYIKADAAYTQNAYNCWIAACLYIVTLSFLDTNFTLTTVHQFKQRFIYVAKKH